MRVEKHTVAAKGEAELPRAGIMVEVAAFGIGEEEAARAARAARAGWGARGTHPDSLDVDRLAADVLKAVAAFEVQEELLCGGGSGVVP